MDLPLVAPEFDEPVPLDEGLLWLRVRLPFALDHVNLLLCDDGDGWTLFDTGYGDAPTRAVWERLLAGLLAGRPIRRVIGTHFHPDHVGLAGLAVRRHRRRAADEPDRMADLPRPGPGRHRRLRRRQRAQLSPRPIWTRRSSRGSRQRRNPYRKGVSEPPAIYTRIVAGDRIELAGSSWQVLIGEGHAPEQVTLFSAERNLLLAADQILPRISPVIGVWAAEPDADPLGDFLRSLRQYRGLPADCRVMPAHGLPYLGPARAAGAAGDAPRPAAGAHARRLSRARDRGRRAAAACSRARSTRIRPASRWRRRWRT